MKSLQRNCHWCGKAEITHGLIEAVAQPEDGSYWSVRGVDGMGAVLSNGPVADDRAQVLDWLEGLQMHPRVLADELGAVAVHGPTPPLEDAATMLAEARQQLALASAAARLIVIAACDEEGMTELAVADALGVNRLTIRRWRGKG